MADVSAPNPAQDAAVKVQQAYVDNGVSAASEAFRKDIQAASSDPTKAVQIEQEFSRLQKDDATTHVLTRMALDWAKPQTTALTFNPLNGDFWKFPDTIDRKKLQTFIDTKDTSVEAQYNKRMATVLATQYNDMTSGFHHYMDAPALALGSISRVDVDRTAGPLDEQQPNMKMAQDANNKLMGNGGTLFNQIDSEKAADHTITKEELDKASADEKLPPDDRALSKTLSDNWTKPTVEQLKQNGAITPDGITKAATDTGVIALPAPAKEGTTDSITAPPVVQSNDLAIRKPTDEPAQVPDTNQGPETVGKTDPKPTSPYGSIDEMIKAEHDIPEPDFPGKAELVAKLKEKILREHPELAAATGTPPSEVAPAPAPAAAPVDKETKDVPAPQGAVVGNQGPELVGKTDGEPAPEPTTRSIGPRVGGEPDITPAPTNQGPELVGKTDGDPAVKAPEVDVKPTTDPPLVAPEVAGRPNGETPNQGPELVGKTNGEPAAQAPEVGVIPEVEPNKTPVPANQGPELVGKTDGDPDKTPVPANQGPELVGKTDGDPDKTPVPANQGPELVGKPDGAPVDKETRDAAGAPPEQPVKAPVDAPPPAVTPPADTKPLPSTPVLDGEGYWDVAARMLRLTDGATPLATRRHYINTELNGSDRAHIYLLMEKMRKANHDNVRSAKLHPGMVLKNPAA